MFNKSYTPGDINIIFDYLINESNEMTSKKVCVFVDYDKTLIKNDSFLNLLIYIIKNNKVKFIYKLLYFFLKNINLSIIKTFLISSPKNYLKYCVSNVILSISGMDLINKFMTINNNSNLNHSLIYKLKKLQNMGFNIIVVSNNYKRFLSSIINKYSFSLIAIDIDKYDSHIYKFNSKSFRIKNEFNKGYKFIFAITDSFKDSDMLKVVSNNIRFDYNQKLFFSFQSD